MINTNAITTGLLTCVALITVAHAYALPPLPNVGRLRMALARDRAMMRTALIEAAEVMPYSAEEAEYEDQMTDDDKIAEQLATAAQLTTMNKLADLCASFGTVDATDVNQAPLSPERQMANMMASLMCAEAAKMGGRGLI